MSSRRLKYLSAVAKSVRQPRYDRNGASGIVHIGVGAFHKAHQAVYTDDAMEKSGGGWMITGVSLRSPEAADALNPQKGLYTLLTRGPEGTSARVVGSIRRVLVAPNDPDLPLAALVKAETKIVSLTITEKGYGLDPKTGGLDRNHPAIAADLADRESIQSALGFIVSALHVRKAAGLPPFTVLSCDNLPSNGKVLRRLVLEFAAARDRAIVSHIENEVSFPSTMVDRITPASTDKTFADAEALIGCKDKAAVETEPFSQWIIEDDFVGGRPDWEAGGAVFVKDVAPYEKMKLRMLNGTHSMLAYAGFIAGHQYVRDVMTDIALARLVRRHIEAASRTLDPVPGVDLARYADELVERFANPAIAHQTYQIAMDGTQKLPQRLVEPAIIALKRGLPLDAYAFAVAAWMRYVLGTKESGEKYSLRDPREAEIAKLIDGVSDAGSIVDRLLGLSGLFPEELTGSEKWRGAVKGRLEMMLAKGMRAAIEKESAGQ
ncbi:mannitol dehydrogenase family protein [Mesorhizobium sp. BAC0120]|uniref:mannitol dehydrogenase family protein n=1 Tax=Mesorhizobium sp. BAC0120 TaxID=3090670 RepID=UPI00298C245E|nr:mannitol dehydrogenase family protein [Mesorhizobium sp. BAC0120]MDW6024932.1 mannitol dehydrogenase family protein [Mesorhizobium sp. BAC0120]